MNAAAFEKRAIGARKVNPIGLGCMSLSHAYGVPPSPAEGAQLLNHALDLGYDHLDTAVIYGAGANEALIGAALKGRRSEFFLASKCGIIIDGEKRRVDCSPAAIDAAVTESLERLQTDFIDLYYLHRRDFNVPIEESVGALGAHVRAGRIGAIGLSEVSADTLRKAARAHPIAAVQNEYSLWTRNPELGIVAACAEVGAALVAFSPLARGVLANGVHDPAELRDGDLRRSHPRFSAENWAKNYALAEAFSAIAAEIECSPAQLSLAWVLSRGAHVLAIPGTASQAHMEENVARADIAMTPELAARLDGLINQSSAAGHRYPEAMRRTIDTEDFA